MRIEDYDGETVKVWAGDSQWRAWKADLARFKKHGYSGWNSAGFWALTTYRLQRSTLQRKPAIAWLPLRFGLSMVKKTLTMVTHINLNQHAKIGPGMLIPHVGPIQVCPNAIIGADCAIHHVCTIGAGEQPGTPVLGDHVMLGCHSCVLGPVKVGDKVKIGAGAVVTRDIPANSTAVGVPARPL